MATATLEQDRTTQHPEVEERQPQTTKKSGRGNYHMKKLEPLMLTNPYPLEFADGLSSDQFCWNKCYKQILEALAFETEKDWLNFCKQVWRWGEESESREAEAAANDLLHQAESDPKVLEALKRKFMQVA